MKMEYTYLSMSMSKILSADMTSITINQSTEIESLEEEDLDLWLIE
jgi:hypothetical protein